jgi:hypothetical protein
MSKKKQSMILHYLHIRRLIGALGFLLPVILILGMWILGEEEVFQGSISKYYHTRMGDFFVGILCMVALFLFSYKGLDDKKERYKIKDNILGNIACILALLVAFCPTGNTLIGTIHLISAGTFLFCLAMFSLVIFTKGDSDTRQQRRRKRIYRSCGIIILACLLLLILYFTPLMNILPDISFIKPILILEIVSLWAFGISWITKGKLFWEDAKEDWEEC